jgi:hypothetical protein
MGFHLEISQIRLARKANGRVQHLSSGNLPMAAFEVTRMAGFAVTLEGAESRFGSSQGISNFMIARCLSFASNSESIIAAGNLSIIASYNQSLFAQKWQS